VKVSDKCSFFNNEIYRYYSSNLTNPTMLLQYLTENNDFMVIGVLGPPGVGKSTIMNELYGHDASSPGKMQLHFVMLFYASFHHLDSLVLILRSTSNDYSVDALCDQSHGHCS